MLPEGTPLLCSVIVIVINNEFYFRIVKSARVCEFSSFINTTNTDVQCTLYTVRGCTRVYVVKHTLYTVRCTLYSVHGCSDDKLVLTL